MLRRLFLVFLLAATFALPDARAAGTEDAHRFADSIGQQVLSVVNAKGNTAQQQNQLQQIFAQNVDIEWMGRFVLGRGWQAATPDQRTRYLQAYRQYLLTRYTSNFTDYNGSKYKITNVKDQGNGEYLVSMDISTPSQQSQDVQAGYRLRAVNGQFKITDIIIEGVSLITTQRSEFASVMQQKNIDALIADLQAKTK